MNNLTCIPSNPDISGIGVRAAIYVQNILSFGPACWALLDGRVSEYALESVETQSTTILLTAFAILISAMVQAPRQGLSNYHASIVLDLSWMNNTNTFIYFLLYVQHKSQAGPHQIKPTFSSWKNHVLDKLSLRRVDGADDREKHGDRSGKSSIDERLESERPVFRYQSPLKLLFRRIALSLGSLHLSMMASLGLWLWNDPASFGTKNSCAMQRASLVISGIRVPLGSRGLRVWSLVIYSVFLVPGLNLILPMVLCLGLFLVYQSWTRRRHTPDPCPKTRISSVFHPESQTDSRVIRKIEEAFLRAVPLFQARYAGRPSSPSIVPIFLGMVILFTTNIICVADIERTLQRNRDLQDAGDTAWTFGQILAMLLLVMPVRDIVETILARREKARLRREREHTEEIERREQKYKVNYTLSLQDALSQEARRELPDMEIIVNLVAKGADPNATTDDLAHQVTALQLAAQQCDSKSVAALLALGADPNIQGGRDGTALQAVSAACTVSIMCNMARSTEEKVQRENPLSLRRLPSSAFDQSVVMERLDMGRLECVRLLLGKGADLNISGGKNGTVLQAASGIGGPDIVKLLLQNGADPNIQGGECGTALVAATSSERMDNVRLLLENGADPNIRVCSFGTALGAASFRGNLALVQLLLDGGADPNIQDENGTALEAAANSRCPEVVKLLLDVGADPNIQGGKYGTALQAASAMGLAEIVKLLLKRGAKPNIQNGYYGTALQAASRGHLEVVKLLLDNAANPHIQGGEYKTALQAASAAGSLAIVKVLLDKGADPTIRGGKYETMLQAAANGGNLDIVSLILDMGADPNTRGGYYETALQAASCRGKLEIVKLLLDKEADPNIRGGRYGTALQAASFWRHFEVVKLLLDNGADPKDELEGSTYGTALEAVSIDGHLALVELLLAKGADPNIRGGSYGTALCAASYHRRLEIVKRLLEEGADPLIEAGEHGTALKAALNTCGNNEEIINLLRERESVSNVLSLS